MSQELKLVKERRWNWRITKSFLFDTGNNEAQQFPVFCLGHAGCGNFSKWSENWRNCKKIKLEKLQNKCDFMESKIKTNLEAISWY